MNTAAALRDAFVDRDEVAHQPAARHFDTPDTPAHRLLAQLSADTQFTGLGIAVLRLTRLTQTADRSLSTLSEALCAEPFIAQKIVRAANVAASQRGGPPVTTVSRAIVLLGLDQVRAMTSSTALIDHLDDRRHARVLQEEFAHSLYATTLARELATARAGIDGEEAAVCTLFRNFGRLMAAMYLHEPFEQALALARSQRISEGEAAARTLGMGFDRLGIEVLNRWRLPDRIIQAALPCPAVVRATTSRHVTLRILAEFSLEAAAAARHDAAAGRRHRMDLLLDRYGEGLGLNRKRLKQALRETDEQAAQLGESLGIFGTARAAGCLEDSPVSGLAPSGNAGAGTLLSAGVASLARMLDDKRPPESVLAHAAQVLKRAYRFQRVLICCKDRDTRTYAVRAATGKAVYGGTDAFAFKEISQQDLFNASVLRATDVYIRDASDPRLRSYLPPWYSGTCPDAQSFLLLPVGLDGGTTGFIYADFNVRNAERLSEAEVRLMKTLKAQCAIAMHQDTVSRSATS